MSYPMNDPRLTEKDFARSVVDYAHLRHWLVYFTWYRAGVNERRQGYQVSGFPDLVLVRPPRLVFAELKVKDNQPTATQKEWLDLLGKVAQVESYLWRETDWSKIMEVLS